MTLERKFEMLRDLLIEIQQKLLHEPNSDYYEYCPDCQRSPYNIPNHDNNCLVVKIKNAMKAIEIT